MLACLTTLPIPAVRRYPLHLRSRHTGIDYASALNPQQMAAVQAPPGPALVLAGAGSGKTRTLTYRVAYLLEQGVPASRILLLTFTNKAAREMLDRVTSLLAGDVAGIWSGTFHAIGNRILRQHPAEAGCRPGFSIMDREDQRTLLAAVRAAAGIDPKEKRFPKAEVLADLFSLAANTARPLDEVLAEKYPYFVPFESRILALHTAYEQRKQEANTVDFDDLLLKPLRLLRANPSIANLYQQRFEFILVDEYQDTNRIQADFIDLLAAGHGNLMVVGDDAQSIYSWRGADFKNILDFPKRHPGARVFKIETNYRSAPPILEVANAALAASDSPFHKVLQPVRPASGIKPALVPLADQNQQALFVTQRILELHEQGVALYDIAVLYRAHFHSMELQMELTRHGVPFRITSGLRFFEQAHIKDVAAFLKFVVNPRDEVAFKRIVQLLPGIGVRGAARLWEQLVPRLPRPVVTAPSGMPAATGRPAFSFREILCQIKVAAKAGPAWNQLAFTLEELAPGGVPGEPAAMISTVLAAVYDDYLKAQYANYEQRLEDVHTLIGYAQQYEEAGEFLDQLALLGGLEDEDEPGTDSDAEGVSLSTVHQAKGLEWKVVFVIWLADGAFPSTRSLDSPAALEEERRLFYVAVTRAADELYLTWPQMRCHAAYEEMVQTPSRFLNGIPAHLFEDWQIENGPF